MEIRALKEKDLPQLANLFDQYRVFYHQASNVDAARLFLEQRLRHGDSAILGAIVHDVLVGFTQLYPTYTSVGLGRIWILNDLYVTADARNRGVGAALMHAAAEYGEMTGAKRLVLATQVENHAAQHLYEKLGWKRDEAFYQYEFEIPRAD